MSPQPRYKRPFYGDRAPGSRAVSESAIAAGSFGNSLLEKLKEVGLIE